MASRAFKQIRVFLTTSTETLGSATAEDSRISCIEPFVFTALNLGFSRLIVPSKLKKSLGRAFPLPQGIETCGTERLLVVLGIGVGSAPITGVNTARKQQFLPPVETVPSTTNSAKYDQGPAPVIRKNAFVGKSLAEHVCFSILLRLSDKTAS